MAARRKWGAIFIAACCLLAGGTNMPWAKNTPAQSQGATHITVNDTVYGVLHNHRSLMSIKENRAFWNMSSIRRVPGSVRVWM